jgi:hypothetical protein
MAAKLRTPLAFHCQVASAGSLLNGRPHTLPASHSEAVLGGELPSHARPMCKCDQSALDSEHARPDHILLHDYLYIMHP